MRPSGLRSGFASGETTFFIDYPACDTISISLQRRQCEREDRSSASDHQEGNEGRSMFGNWATMPRFMTPQFCRQCCTAHPAIIMLHPISRATNSLHCTVLRGLETMGSELGLSRYYDPHSMASCLRIIPLPPFREVKRVLRMVLGRAAQRFRLLRHLIQAKN
jgi:hypothetical protein